MSNIPDELKYTKSHEWIKESEDGNFLVGITDHAQDQLGDMVYVELQEAGQEIAANAECAVVESVKAASDVYMPVAGTIVESNTDLSDQPELINQDPYNQAWLLKIKPANPDDVQSLMSAEDYAAFLESEDH